MKVRQPIQARELKFRVDDAVILAAAAKVAAQSNDPLTPDEEAALLALRRAHPSAGSTDEELSQWLGNMDPDQLRGVISNTKGVLHEMRVVELENSDGDTIYAAQFEATNHGGFDVVFSDASSGDQWEAQLKATESTSYVKEWMAAHPDGQLIVTDEIAERLGLETSGISNADLTADTKGLVDKLVMTDESDALWEYLPALSAVSIAMVIFELYGRLDRGEIGQQQFRWMIAKASGQRATRVAAITVLLSIPGLNILTAIGLISNALASSGVLETINRKIANRLEAMDALSDFEKAIYSEKIWLEAAIENAHSEYEHNEHMKDPNYRRFHEEITAKFEAFDAENHSSSSFSALERDRDRYVNPDDIIPALCDNNEVEQRVRAKVGQLQSERHQRIRAANDILASDRLAPHFKTLIERYAGVEDGRRLLEVVGGMKSSCSNL